MYVDVEMDTRTDSGTVACSAELCMKSLPNTL